MPYLISTATKRISLLNKRIRAIPGGTSAGKTISIEQILIHFAQTDKTPTLTSIVAESIPHLKRGAIRDFKNMMISAGYWKDSNWNATDSIYTFETKSQIEFFSTDNADKLRGARRDRLFINEANNISFDAFEQLEVRTKEFVFLDWNPTNEFWYYTEVKKKRNDVEELTLTYKDNEGLSPEIIASIEQRKNRKGWWKVYGEGQLGEVEGKIYKDWQIIDELPFEAKLERYGVDFGYTNDPTAIVAVYYYNGGYIVHELAYRKGMNNKMIADVILNQEVSALVIADSAEPKSIDDIRSYGVQILGVTKTSGGSKSETFVKWSIGVVQEQKISVTKQSVNVIHEYRNYLWMTGKDGKILNEPEHTFKHSMDAVAYSVVSLVKTAKTPAKQFAPAHIGGANRGYQLPR